jgi:hypothetical protein
VSFTYVLRGLWGSPPVNAHIANSNTIDKKINDLAYKGDYSSYDTVENIERNINVGYIVRDPEHEWMSFFGIGPSQIYLYALKDINESEELSRYYGLDYWLESEFWQRFPNSQYKLTQAMEDLPSEWVFVDEIRSFLEQNYHMNLFAKKVGDQYHYFVSNKKPNYFDPQFADKLNNVIMITKDDYSPYKYDEMIYDGMFLTQYLKKEDKGNLDSEDHLDRPKIVIIEPEKPERHEQMKTNKEQFWAKYPQCNYSKHDQNHSHYGLPIIDDFPPEYVPSTILHKDGDGNLKRYYLYCKKVGGTEGNPPKYYYMLDLNTGDTPVRPRRVSMCEKEGVQKGCPLYYYDPSFAEKSVSFVDVTKDDFTKYETHDCILGNMHTMEHHDIELMNKIQKERTHKKNFWKKHLPHGNPNGPEDNQWNQKTMGEFPSEYVLVGYLQESLKSLHYYDFYAKKVNDKYYYLVGTQKEHSCYYGCDIQYYQPEFAEKLSSFVDVTKKDYSSYNESECILGHLYLKTYLIKSAIGK